jgi:hypothetical protein
VPGWFAPVPKVMVSRSIPIPIPIPTPVVEDAGHPSRPPPLRSGIGNRGRYRYRSRARRSCRRLRSRYRRRSQGGRGSRRAVLREIHVASGTRLRRGSPSQRPQNVQTPEPRRLEGRSATLPRPCALGPAVGVLSMVPPAARPARRTRPPEPCGGWKPLAGVSLPPSVAGLLRRTGRRTGRSRWVAAGFQVRQAASPSPHQLQMTPAVGARRVE